MSIPTIKIIVAAAALCVSQAHAAADCTYLAGPPDAGIATAAKDSTGVSQAWYGQATTDYAHGVLGDAIEANILYAQVAGTDTCAAAIKLPEDSVFEDITPRIGDVTGDGRNDVIVIESHRELGASIAIYSIDEAQLLKVASTPYIGTAYRWLAPVGVADFTGDAVADVAYVETPHIGGNLKVWSFKNEKPLLIGSAPGFSNHRIGQNYITGGIRDCGKGPEMVVPGKEWDRTLIATVVDDTIVVDTYADNSNRSTIDLALQCR